MRMMPGPRLPVTDIPFGHAEKPFGTPAPSGPAMNHRPAGNVVDFPPRPSSNLHVAADVATHYFIGKAMHGGDLPPSTAAPTSGKNLPVLYNPGGLPATTTTPPKGPATSVQPSLGQTGGLSATRPPNGRGLTGGNGMGFNSLVGKANAAGNRMGVDSVGIKLNSNSPQGGSTLSQGQPTPRALPVGNTWDPSLTRLTNRIGNSYGRK